MLSEGDPPGLASGLLERRIHHPRVENALDLECSWIDDVDRGWIRSHLILRLEKSKRAGPHKLRPRLHYLMHNKINQEVGLAQPFAEDDLIILLW